VQHSTLDQHLLAFLPGSKAIVAGARITDSSAYRFHVDVRVVEVPSGKVRKEFALPSGRGKLGMITPDGKRLIVSGGSELAAVHDLATGKEVTRLIDPERAGAAWPNPAPLTLAELKERRKREATRMTISRDGKWLAVGTRDGWLSVWDLVRYRRLWRKEASTWTITSLDFSPDGETMVSVDESSRIVFWRRRDAGRQLECTRYISPAMYLSDGETLLLGVGRSLGFVRWNPSEDRIYGRNWLSERDKYGDVERRALSSDRRIIATLRSDGQIDVWNLGLIWPK
jgi:hypothetical protein